MNLTDRVVAARARRVWRKALEPAAVALRERGVDPLGAPADDADSWYTMASTSTHFVDVADVERALVNMWDEQGMPELSACSRDIAKLMEAVRRSNAVQREVSSDVYAMY